MKHNKLDDLNCSIANALDLIGEWWTILILREAFFGTCRFEDFQHHLGIARNILAARLRKLCDNGVLKRVPIKEGAKRHEYKLTSMGRDLYPTLIALTQWGDRWLHEEGAPVRFIERATGDDIADVAIRTKQGRELDARDLALIPGPGATDETRERLHLLQLAWEKHNGGSR
ncbi:MAG TPA: transcriptional regulator [Gammaproteobacteria bacterium]|nr:transcriptional regulator [Gammaproteobacteria bacterium]